MKVGSLGYATYQGLGILLKDFYDHGIVTDVMTVNHWFNVNHKWYNGPTTDLRRFSKSMLRDFVADKDVMVFFETPFDMDIIAHCRSVGVRTILIPMYECMPELNIHNIPDLIINPSPIDQQHFPSGKYLPVPVPDRVEWKLRERANVFVHNAGHLGIRGRNGTKELVEAMQYVQSPIKLILRSQERLPSDVLDKVMGDIRIEYQLGTVPFNKLYDQGDVFILPMKFGGLSLPLQEARASGMLTLCCSTMGGSIPIEGTEKIRVLSNVIDQAILDPKKVAKVIDDWYGEDISQYSLGGKEYKEEMSWNSLKDRWMQAIAGCLVL